MIDFGRDVDIGGVKGNEDAMEELTLAIINAIESASS